MNSSLAKQILIKAIEDYKANRVQYKQTYKRPIKNKEVINRLKKVILWKRNLVKEDGN